MSLTAVLLSGTPQLRRQLPFHDKRPGLGFIKNHVVLSVRKDGKYCLNLTLEIMILVESFWEDFSRCVMETSMEIPRISQCFGATSQAKKALEEVKA